MDWTTLDQALDVVAWGCRKGCGGVGLPHAGAIMEVAGGAGFPHTEAVVAGGNARATGFISGQAWASFSCCSFRKKINSKNGIQIKTISHILLQVATEQ